MQTYLNKAAAFMNFCYHQALNVNKNQAVKGERYSEKWVFSEF